MKPGERFGCGILALLVFIAFTFGFLGGGLAGAGVVVLTKALPGLQPAPTPTSVPAHTVTPAPTALPAPAPGPTTVVDPDAPVVQAVNVVGPAVVTVITTLPPRRGFFGRTARPESRGSGVIIDAAGHAITNNHVVEGAESLSVILANGERREAQLVGADQFTDLAVIRIAGSGFGVAELASTTVLAPGQRVIAIGSALGDFRNTVTVGVVSGIGRGVDMDEGYRLEDLIQTDAAINQGNSGGPLVDLSGRVVGINTLIVGRSSGGVVAEGLGFATAAKTVRSVADQIIATGQVARPFLGLGYQAVTPGLASYYGLSATSGILVTEVSPRSPAAQAGVQPGDVILQISGERVDETNPYLNVLMRHKPGDKITLAINRGGQVLSLDVTLGRRE